MKARRALAWGLLAVAVGLFAYHAWVYGAWTEDDAFITFRYAQNVAHGHGFVFNPGERVEGYSNFAWMLIAAAVIRSGHDPVLFAKILGVLAGAIGVVLAWLLARRISPQAGLTTLVAPLYLAVSPVLAQHSVTGLETSFFAMLLVAAVLLAAGNGKLWRSVLFVLVLLALATTRPEGPFLALVLLLLRSLETRLQGGLQDWDAAEMSPWSARAVPPRGTPGARAPLVEAAVFVVVFGTYFAWRWHYFGAPLPNTFYAKSKGGLHGLIDGAQYTLDFMRDAGGPLFMALALAPLLVGPRRPAYWIALGMALASLGFVLVSGGDWMFNYRFFAHVLPVIAALVAAGIEHLLALPRPGTLRAVLLYATMALVLLATTLGLGNTELKTARIVLPALARHNYLSQNYEELGRWFHDNTPDQATVAISDVGAVGYFSNRRILDMFGLVDPHIARLPGRMHYKADPKYVLSRRPDYIVLVSLNDEGQGYSFQRIPDWGMNAQPEFHETYELIRTEPQYWQNEFVLVYRRRE